MYRYFLLVFALILSLHADRTIRFDAGWQLAGLTQARSDMHLFDDHALIVWAFDASTQHWQAYSPDPSIMQKIADKGIAPLKELKAYQGFWIDSAEAWELPIKPNPAPNTTDAPVTLELKSGWNLVTLPEKTVLDTALFGDDTVWKYSGEWAVKSGDKLPFPAAESVRASEGFWVRAKKDKSIDIPYAASALHTFDTKEAMIAYLKSMVLLGQGRYYDHLILPMTDFNGGEENDFLGNTSDNQEASDATSTNVQEAGVDESDILKHDGKNIFFADRSSHTIRMTTFAKLASGSKQSTPVTDFNGTLQGMYLQQNRLIVITQEMRYYIMKETSTLDNTDTGQNSGFAPSYTVPHFFVTWYDVTDPENIVKLRTQRVDGHYSESRLSDGKLYLVSQFSPIASYSYTYTKAYAKDDRCIELHKQLEHEGNTIEPDAQNTSIAHSPEDDEYYRLRCYRYNYDENGSAWYYEEHPHVTFGQMIPSISDGTHSEDYVAAQHLYAPYKIDQAAQITTAGAFDALDGTLLGTTSYTGYVELTYASADALYLVSKQYPYYYDYDYYKERSAVYKFTLDENLSYRGRGFVDGRMLNQYSLSEYDNILRIAATSGWSWGAGETDNAVFTLAGDGNQTLRVTGALRGLGKKGETIKAVRFVGTKGFVVTFRQTDPLYTIDLSDPSAPRKVGELNINGFSEYLHPIDANRILSVGRDADADGRTTGLLLQLYDISDFANPVLADTLRIADRSTHSEVENNPRALAFRTSDLLFGIPLYGAYDGYDVGFNVYQISGMSIVPRNKLTQNSDGYWYGYEGRGVLFDFGGKTYGTLFKGGHTLTETITTGADK